ncbi:G5 domain-containing protein [Pseudosporangium ferrugineum]|uniref:G5 domain-containing protein n=1 Tax=Pseudosporangium ferrugineum TaxID=439699 RepID=UPI000D058F4C|nr:G5 domain-containing protein [Pseudosporangium ferrugineum]
MPFGVRMTTAGLGVLALVAGTAGGVAAMTRDEPVRPVVEREAVVAAPLDMPARPPAARPKQLAGEVRDRRMTVAEDRSGPGEADRTATRAPRRSEPSAAPAARVAAAAPVAPRPAVRTERVSETQTIPFRTLLVRDPSLPPGTKQVRTRGVPGERVLHYEVTYTGSQESARRLLDSTVTREPTNRVIAFGPRRGGGGHHGGGPDRDGRGDGCGRDGWECAPAPRGARCSDETAPEEEDLLDQHLGLLSSDDLDALDLTLPCEPGPEPEPTASKPPAKK